MSEVRRKRKRRKKSKKPLWITLIIILVVGGAGWGGFYYLTHRDVQAEDIGVEQDFFDFSEFDMDLDPESKPNENGEDSPDGKGGTSTVDGTNQQPGDQTEKPEKGADSTNTDPTPPINETPEKEKPNQAKPTKPIDKKQEIENKYAGVFKKLESLALTKLDTLAVNAIKDYRAGRSLADISSSYMSGANKLQANVDKVFYSQLNRMKEELKANGLDNELAVAAESSYKNAIAAKKSEMMDKVTQFSGK